MLDNNLLPGGNPAEWVRNVLKRDDARGKQRKIGPSEIGTPCTYCLAERLLGIKPPQGPYWLGARIGTACHQAVEEGSMDIPGVLPETKVAVGELAGYGVIKGTADTQWVEQNHLLDLKTTTKSKLKVLKDVLRTEPSEYDTSAIRAARFKIKGYLGQLHLYGRGIGGIEDMSIVFLCRDGSTDSDIWSWSTKYQPEYAEKVWGRLEAVWAALQSGRELDTFVQHTDCYTCTNTRS